MELDKTRIAVRERGILETLDLALHVTRAYAGPLLMTMALGALPMILLNDLLIGWMQSRADNELDFPGRFLWNLCVLVFLEAPLASVFATTYLGQAVFLERPRLRDVLRTVGQVLPRLLWCHLLVRGVGLGWLLVLSLDRYGGFDPWAEGFLLGILVLYVAGLRASRPFVNEIVLLEQNPLLRSSDNEMTIHRRSTMLHGPSSGDLISRWFVGAVISALLVVAIHKTFLYCKGILLYDWTEGVFLLRYMLPVSMWIVVGFTTVFRFLSYLDTRIRQEGWEVSLLLRAEGTRIRSSLTVPIVAMLFVLAPLAGPVFADWDDQAAVDAARDSLDRRGDYPWYDPAADGIQRVDVRPPEDLASHRNSTWEWQEANAPAGGGGLWQLIWGVLKVLSLGLIICLLLAVSAALARAFLRKEFRPETGGGERGRDRTHEDRIESLPFQVDRNVTDFLSEARRQYEAGQYGQAIVYLFSYQLVRLDQHRAIRLARGKTNRQYLSELRDQPNLRTALERTMVVFEEVFFGHHPLDRQGFELCWSSLDDFHRMLQT